MKKTTALTLMLVAGAFATASATAATGSGSTTAPTDTRDYTLTVASAHGNPTPAVGTHTYAWQATVSASVEAAVPGFSLVGWTGSGSVPETGDTHATGDIVLTEVASSITWQWEAEAQTHTVTLHPGEHGSIVEANDGASFVTSVAHGAPFPAVTVVPDAWYDFLGFSPEAPATVTGDFVAVAQYGFTDTDGDGLPDDWELHYFGHLNYGPDDDPDGDGRTNLQEFLDGTDPTDPGSTLGLVAYYPFDGNADDASGNGHHGTVHGAILAPDRFGSNDQAYHFNGSQRIALGRPDDLKMYSEVTVSAWVMFNGGTMNPRIVSAGVSERGGGYEFFTLGNGSQRRFRGYWGGFTLDTDQHYAENVWYHAIFVGHQFGGELYINGILDGERSEVPTQFGYGSDFEIGRKGYSGHDGWGGSIDDVRIYNRALDAEEIARLYAAGSTEPPPVPLPDLSLSAADLRILNAAGAETWNPAIGEAVTVEVTLRNTGDAATSGDILVQLFLDGAPANLAAYDINAFSNVASTVVAESMSVDGSRTLLLPWTATGPDRVATLTAVAEFAANRAQSQANAAGASEPLPVAEVSFANNSVGRSLQIGSPAAGEFGIEVDAEAPADMLSGVSYTLTGAARYDWDANEPVLGALVTVTVGDTTITTRTTSPDGAWSVALPGLPEGNHPALVQVHDGRLTGSTPLTLVVSAGPETRDLRITEFGFVSGAYRVEGQTAYAATGDSLVLRARVRNDGNAPCGPFEVAFKDPAGAAFSTVTVPGLAAFSSVWVEADAGWMVEAGTHTLSALADSGDEIEETNEHNNSRACTVIGTAALPDLAPVSIGFAPGGPKAGDTVTISTVIENRGGTVLPAGAAFDVAFSVNGTVVATETVAPASDLAPGASLTVSTTHTFAEHGAFTVGVRADSGDDIDETREDNNALSRTLTVRKALPDLRPFYRPNAWTTVSGLSFSPSQPVAGEAVTVSCDIYNAGTVPLGAGAAFDVRFSAGDTPFATERVTLGAELPVGGKVTVTTLWNGGPAGPVTIAADVDTEDEIEEEHETNNRTTRGMTVFPADAALVAASLTTSPLQPLPGAAVTLTATVRNDGGAAGGAGAVVEFFAGSTDPSDKIGETTLDADIAPKGDTATAAFAWSAPATPGVVTIFAKVGDSTAQRNLTVTANPAPNLQVFSEDIAFDPPLPLRGASVTVSATVRNTEGSAATDFLVRFYVEAPGIGFVDLGAPVPVASLAAGTETTVQANAPIIAERSAYTVKVELVPNPEQGDADASDNAATSSFVLADTPVADAGADSACIVGQTATLDGTASRNATAFAWTLIERPAGSEAELASANTATPSLTPDLPGLYRAQLIVGDGLLQSTPDTLAITARYLTLEVISAHGEPDPAVGIHSYTWQAAVDVQSTEVDEVDPGRTRHLCTGWVGTGSVPTEGDAATVSFVIAEDSTLTWQWATEHWLQVDPEGSGTVSVDSGWQAAGSNVVLTATPEADHRFTGWSGDIEDCVIDGLEITAPMTGPRSLTATFVSALHTVTLHQGLYGQIAGADGGGAYTVTVAYGNAFPEVNVTPSAGFLFAGWSPAAPAVIEADFEAAARYRPDANVIAMAAAEILASAHAQQAHDLYTPEALRHLFPSPLMIEVDPVTGEVHIDLQMQWSDDLSNWQPFGEILRWTDAETGDKRFYRLQLMEPLSDE